MNSKVKEQVLELFDEWEKENTEALKTEDIIKKKIVIADYIKWDKVRELRRLIQDLK